jgi:hypothetical protein
MIGDRQRLNSVILSGANSPQNGELTESKDLALLALRWYGKVFQQGFQ